MDIEPTNIANNEIEKSYQLLNKRLEKRAYLLAQAEQDFNNRVKKEAHILAENRVNQARKERDNARQKAKRLQHKLALFGII